MQIMLLMGSSRITINHEEYPLYLTEIDEKLILERQISYCKNLLPAKFLFCVNTGDIKFFHVDSIINQIAPDSEIIPVNGATKGAICTALLGATHINNDDELILLGVDDFVEDSGKEILTYFHKNHSDAGVVSFNSVHPRYSFARTDHNDNVTEVAEKRPISKNALVSFYYFRHGFDFVECAKEVIRKDNSVGGSFYISQTLNEMVLKQKKVSLYKIANDQFHPLKTEKQLYQYMQALKEEKDSK